MNIIEIFYTSDNIVKLIEKNSNKKENKVGRRPILSRSEYVTLAIVKQEMGFKTTLDLYNFVKDFLDREFPKVPTYQQFCAGINDTLEYFVFVSWVLCTAKKADYSWYYIIDSTPLEVCNNNYRYNSKIFKGLASSGKNMKQLPATDIQNLLLSRRQKVESVFSFLKHRLSIVDRYARSAIGFFVGVFSAIVSYQLKNALFIGNIDGSLIS